MGLALAGLAGVLMSGSPVNVSGVVSDTTLGIVITSGVILAAVALAALVAARKYERRWAKVMQ